MIGSALLRTATGASTGEIARELGRARTTVRNWLRRLEDNASAAQVIRRRTLLDTNGAAWRLVFDELGFHPDFM